MRARAVDKPKSVGIRQLKAQLSQAELIISAQKKLAQALEQALTPDKDKP
jgi:hypothetical protein